MTENRYKVICPVCEYEAEYRGTTDHGGRRGINCPRCGFYVITATVVSMLPNRIQRDPILRARLSHQIRKKTKNDNPLVLDSYILDDLSKAQLPEVDEQIILLLNELASRAGENRLGTITIKDLGTLAGIVGSIDASGVRSLINEAKKEGLIDSTQSDLQTFRISITRMGWQKIRSPLSDHSDSSNNIQKAILTRSPPEWLPQLPDEILSNILSEVYQGLNSGLLMLLLVGARTAFDRAMHNLVGDPPNGFKGKLSKMEEQKFLTSDDVLILQPMIDAGSAAVHRGFMPTAETTAKVITEMEHILYRLFLRKNAAAAVFAATPVRPK